MLTGNLVLALVPLLALQTPPATPAQAAERALRNNPGARFSTVSLRAIFLETPAEAERSGRGQLYLNIDDAAKFGRDNLKLLRDLPNLKELCVGPDFPEAWCRELEKLTQLEGLYVLGEGRDRPGLTDRGLASVARLRNLQSLSLLGTAVTDDGLRHVRGLTRLRWLSLSGARNLSNEGLVHLKGLKDLEQINMDGTRVTAAGLFNLRGLTKLKNLRLPAEQRDWLAEPVELDPLADPAELLGLVPAIAARQAVGLTHLASLSELGRFAPPRAAGLAHLADMTELRRLDARGLVAGDDDLKVVRNMTKLEELDLGDSAVSDEGLAHLAGLTELRSLDLFSTGVTGDGLRHLRPLRNLRHLNLGACPLDDRAVEHLRRLPQLESLDVGLTRITEAGAAALRRHLPNTKVGR